MLLIKILEFTLISTAYCTKSDVGYYVTNHGVMKLMITGITKQNS